MPEASALKDLNNFYAIIENKMTGWFLKESVYSIKARRPKRIFGG